MKCKIKSCIRKIHHKTTAGLCRSHYDRLKKHGDTYADVLIKSNRTSLPVRRKILQAKPGYKYCQHCNKYRKAKEFHKRNLCMCKYCTRNIGLKKYYGIDNQDYNKLLKKQKDRCALCRTKEPGGAYNVFYIDHNHETGKIRGLLCRLCNALIIGGIEKRKISIVRLVRYLER